MTTSSKRGVIEVREVDGPKGGKILVHILSCGHWHTRRTPARAVECIACWVSEQIDPGVGRLTEALAKLDDRCSNHMNCDDRECDAIKSAAWEVVEANRARLGRKT
jgi:hypothetical protein